MPENPKKVTFKRSLSDFSTINRRSNYDRHSPILDYKNVNTSTCNYCNNAATLLCYDCNHGGKQCRLCYVCNQIIHANDGTIDGWGTYVDSNNRYHFRTRLFYMENELMNDEDRNTEYKSVLKHRKG